MNVLRKNSSRKRKRGKKKRKERNGGFYSGKKLKSSSGDTLYAKLIDITRFVLPRYVDSIKAPHRARLFHRFNGSPRVNESESRAGVRIVGDTRRGAPLISPFTLRLVADLASRHGFSHVIGLIRLVNASEQSFCLPYAATAVILGMHPFGNILPFGFSRAATADERYARNLFARGARATLRTANHY